MLRHTEQENYKRKEKMASQTYTSSYGNTQQGGSLQSLQDTLGKILNVPANDRLGQAETQVGGQLVGMQQNLPQYTSQSYQQLNQQSGIPQLTQQYGDLGQAFQMYLADQGLSQKYAAPANASLLASPEASQGGEGFQGFTVPSITTQAMGTPLNATNDFLNSIVGAISMAQGGVKDQMTKSIDTYKSGMDTLSTIVSLIDKERTRQQDLDLRRQELYMKYSQSSENPLTLEEQKSYYNKKGEHPPAGITRVEAEKQGYTVRTTDEQGKIVETNDAAVLYGDLKRMLKLRSTLSSGERLTGMSPAGQNYRTLKSDLAIRIANLHEGKRISDQDYKRYFTQLGTDIYPQQMAEGAVEGILGNLRSFYKLVEVTEKATGKRKLITPDDFDPNIFEEIR